MTSEQRLKAVMARRPPDRTPWSPMLGDSYLRSRPEYFGLLTPDQQQIIRESYRYPSVSPVPSRLGFERDILRKMVADSGGDALEGANTVCVLDPDVSIHQTNTENGTQISINTPWGNLTEVVIPSDAETVFRTRHAIQDAADYDVFLRILQNRRFVPDTHAWTRAESDLGDRGACCVNGPDLPLVSLFRIREPSQVIFDLHDDSQRMRELLDLLEERSLEVWRQIAEGPGTMVITGAAFLTTQLISPKIFAEYVQPHLAACVNVLHTHGKILLCHMCGRIKRLLPMLRESAVDGIDSLTNPPLGDTTLENFWRVMGDRAILKSGISPVLLRNGTLEQVQAEAAEVLAEAEGRHLILSTADDVLFGTPVENLRAVAEAVAG